MIEEYFGKIKWLFIEQISGIYANEIFATIIVAAAVTLLPGYVLHEKKGVPIKKVFLAFLTVSYAGIMFLLTIFRREPGSRPMEIFIGLNLGITLDGIYSPMEMVYSLFNFFMFFFWGILIGLFRTAQKPVKIVQMTTLVGFVTSFSIEFIQLLTGTGSFELTDLLTNVTGAFFGALFVALGVIISKRMNKNG